MWFDTPPKSDIACLICRKRKIKCGRELPHCGVCRQTNQTCEYPPGHLKPGPKIGSLQKRRKRQREEAQAEPTPTPTQSEQQRSISPKQTVSPAGPTTAPASSARPSLPAGSVEPEALKPDEADEDAEPASADASKQRRDSQNTICYLSYILHPSHEASTPPDTEKEKDTASPTSSKESVENQQPLMIARACYALRVTPDDLKRLVGLYFENMVSITLFREPNFEEKISKLQTPAQVHALLAAMLAFSSRFCGHDDSLEPTSLSSYNPATFLSLATKFIAEALEECGDESPPLAVLQAHIISTHVMLSQGVRGKAWRAMGACVRLAYELNLHLIDAIPVEHTSENAARWIDDEEKRRAWWAVWEMDVFASTIRRCPTAVDWSHMETLLPVEDKYWFAGTPTASCLFELDLITRCKTLQESGNQSPKAWFIVINSLMKQAQMISKPRAIMNLGGNFFSEENMVQNASVSPWSNSGVFTSPAVNYSSTADGKQKKLDARRVIQENRDKLEMLSNSVRCFSIALPVHLRYRNQYLSFDAREPGQQFSFKQQHCGIHNIYLMTQLAKLMIHHYDVFGSAARATASLNRFSNKRPGNAKRDDELALSLYLEAADNILLITRRSHEDHVKYINPFLASTIWLASAVELVHKEFGPSGTNRGLIKSKFEVLYQTYKKCVSFWGIETALQHNLELLEEELERYRKLIEDQLKAKPKNGIKRARKESTTSDTQEATWTQEIKPKTETSSPNLHDERAAVTPKGLYEAAKGILPAQPADADEKGPVPQSNILSPEMFLDGFSPSLSALDFLRTSLRNSPCATPGGGGVTTASNGFSEHSPSSAVMSPELKLFGESLQQSLGYGTDSLPPMAFGLHMDGSSLELASYLDELLSGSVIY
ncbi:fungal-specific transcription factor domain-containing protein [Myxozyma melibiosi]|uniref:Fungal-specific transcription factor domain-containing protein n=1 Tax=Myxozyma melibiosi TaxID=54550 RepID=A0ABR1FCT5_9ASCO